MSVAFDTKVGDMIIGSGLSVTPVGATLTSSAKQGMALNVDAGNKLDLGTHNGRCLGNISACNDALTVCMWIHGLAENKWGGVFNNNGGLKLSIKGVDPNILIHLHCVPPVGASGQKYEYTIAGDITGYNHYCFSCSKTSNGKVFLNGQEHFGIIQSSSSGGTSGKVKMATGFGFYYNVDELNVWEGAELDAATVSACYEGYN